MVVRSPPSSRIMLRGFPVKDQIERGKEESATEARSRAEPNVGVENEPPGKAARVCSIHQSNSSSVSPFQAKTGTPVAAMAAAAWS